MSLEESMNVLAASNNRLADAFDNYAAHLKALAAGGVVSFAGVPASSADERATPAEKTAPAAAAAEKTTRTRRTKEQIAADDAAAKAAAAPAATDTSFDDDFGFGDEPAAPEKVYKLDEVRGAILKLRDKGGANANRQAALDLMAKYGVKSPAEIKPADFNKVMADIEAQM